MNNTVDPKILGISEDKTTTINYCGVNIEVKKMLQYSEMVAFVDAVSNSCFDESDGRFMPEMRDYATRYAIIRMYTNVSLPKDDDVCYRFVYEHTSLISDILSSIDGEQFDAMDRAISAKIGNIAECNINEINKKINDIYNSIMESTNQFGEVFDGISDDDIKKLFGAISKSLDNGFNENSFVEAYMNNK